MTKNSLIKFLTVCFVIFFAFGAVAQETTNAKSLEDQIKQLQKEIEALKGVAHHGVGHTTPSSYDPLVPQYFAVDAKTQTYAALNLNENTLEIIKKVDTIIDGKKRNVLKNSQFLVDKWEGRHDANFIFQPKSVAIYESHIVYLASSKDSSLIRVLNIDGELLEEFRFNGAASSFSYDQAEKKLYIAGDNPKGYDFFVIDAKDGFDKLTVKDSPSFHYRKPKKADAIKERDPYGAGLAVIAMGTVFLSLITIFLVLKAFGFTIVSIQNKRSRKKEVANTGVEQTKGTKPNAVSGEEFAAIAAAIHLYNYELHDEEKIVLTINKVQKTYSPWSSKLYNMNVYKR